MNFQTFKLSNFQTKKEEKREGQFTSAPPLGSGSVPCYTIHPSDDAVWQHTIFYTTLTASSIFPTSKARLNL